MKQALLVLAATIALASCISAQCNQYNNTYTETTVYVTSDRQEHVDGLHSLVAQGTVSCTYTGGPGQACKAECVATPTVNFGMIETGKLSNLIYDHFTGDGNATGTSVATSPTTASCQVSMAGSVKDCLPTGCAVTVGVTAGAGGFGVSVSFPPGALWDAGPHYFNNTCPAYTAPSCTGSPNITCAQQCGGFGSPSVVCAPNNIWRCSDGTPGCTVPPPYLGCTGGLGPTCNGSTWYCGTGCYSPIVIDTTGEGFHLTSAADGVLFDLTGNGVPIQLAWTKGDSGNGWLALDRNHNGKIDNGTELFGNYTNQAKCDDPNGFLALAVFDKPENGGNGDGLIDNRDAIWPQLLVWIDANHDGVSQPEELHHLDDLGIHSISLQYRKSPYTDEYGNQFRYKGLINVEKGQRGKIDHKIYDVFLVGAGQNSNNSSEPLNLGTLNSLR